MKLGSTFRGAVVENAYPDRDQAKVGAEYKTMVGCERVVEKAEQYLATVTAQAKATVSAAKAELAASQKRFAKHCKGFTQAQVDAIIAAQKDRREEAEEIAAAVRDVQRRRAERKKKG